MKKVIIITLFTLLTTNNNLHAGCWMPESDTVKNHYKGKDGGYVLLISENISPFFHKATGIRPSIIGHLRLKGRYDRHGNFIPTGFKTKKHLPGRNIISEHRAVILNIASKYWPLLKKEKTQIMVPKKYHYPCYLTSTDASFEKWKQSQHISPFEKMVQKEKQKIQARERERARKAREKRRKEEKERKQQEEAFRKLHM